MTTRFRTALTALLLLGAVASASAQSTKITSSGTLPASCVVGNIRIKTGTGVGLYECLSANTWTVVATGSGFGDVFGPSSSVDAEIALFSGTGGKTIKRATGSGLAKVSSGVFSVASAGTDYVAPGAITSSGLTQATGKLLGRSTASTGAVEEITVGTGLSLSAGSLTATGGGSGTVTNTGTLTANRVVLGNGGVDVTVLGSLGTTTSLLHGNAGGAPTFAAVDLAADVSGDLPFANLAQGSALSVLGVTGNATADVASIAAGSDKQVLRRAGTAVAFGAVDLTSSAAVTGVLPIANIATGTPNGTKFVRDDGTLAVPSGSGTVTTSGSPATGNLAKFSGSTAITNADLTGDVTTSGGVATTLATSGVSAGSYTSANITVDAKGRVTAAANGAGTLSASFVFLAGDVNNGHNPADATTYHFGLRPGNNPTTGTDFTSPVMPKAGTVKVVTGQARVQGTLASAGSSTVTVSNITATTTENVTTSLAMTSLTNAFSNTGMTLAFSAGDRFEITILTPTWATNPTVVLYMVTVYVEFS